MLQPKKLKKNTEERNKNVEE